MCVAANLLGDALLRRIVPGPFGLTAVRTLHMTRSAPVTFSQDLVPAVNTLGLHTRACRPMKIKKIRPQALQADVPWPRQC